tara:strand:- start:192 stop:464 length:273 start_codon:yes stop_codon:yes gene_type:complete
MSSPSFVAPSLPVPPVEYDSQYMMQLLNVLRLYFNQLDNPGFLASSGMNFNLDTLPTQADLATLRLGDVYRDTVDGVQATSQMLRIKTSL